MGAPHAGAVLPCNEVFPVSEALVGQDQRIYLKLADGRGWVFDDSLLVPHDPSVVRGHWEPAPAKPQAHACHPGNNAGLCGTVPPGVLTVPAESQASPAHPPQHHASPAFATSPPSSSWFQVKSHDGMEVHSAPDLSSPLTGAELRFDESVCVSESVIGSDGREWLRLADGLGWIFNDCCCRSASDAALIPNGIPDSPAVVLVESPMAAEPSADDFWGPALVGEGRRWVRGKRGGVRKRRSQQ